MNRLRPIPISSCHKCLPLKWQVKRPSNGVYWCLRCESAVTSVLEKKKFKIVTNYEGGNEDG